MGMELSQDRASHGLTEEDIIHIPGMQSQWVKLADGSRAHYTSSGETGPAIILLHGGIVGSSGTAGWRFMAPFLGANGFRVYCPDQPAFGWSDTRPEYYPTKGQKSYVEFVEMFADALCLDRFHLSGNSFGCTNTAYYVMNHPERILNYILIAGGVGANVVEVPRVPPSEGKFTPNPAYQNIPFDGTEKSMSDLMMGIIYEAKAVWPELVSMRTKAALRQADSQKARQEAQAKLNEDPNYQQWINAKGRIDKMTIPAVALWGMQDVLSPVENGFAQEDAMPNVQYFYPDQCGHQGQTDQPEMFNQLFLEFFRSGKVSWKTAEWAGVSRRRAINPKLVDQPIEGFPAPEPSRYTRGEPARV